MIYFKNRLHAGELLADELHKYAGREDVVVVALNPGGVVAGQALASKLGCSLTLLLIKPIEIPGVNKEVLGMINQRGDFVYNDRIPTGTLEELESEFHNLIEQEKMEEMHKINELIGHQGIVTKQAIEGKVVIAITDGLKTGASLDALSAYLKPFKIQALVGAIPLATVGAVDRLHILCDEIHVLDVVPDTFDVDHYYDDQEDFSQDKITEILNTSTIV